MKLLLGVLAMGFACGVPQVAAAQSVAETRQVVEVVKPNWIAVRAYDGQDLLYFTTLISWRCGIDKIMYSVNGGPEKRYKAEECYVDEAVPGAIKAQDILPYVTFDLDFVQTVEVRVVFGDGSEMRESFARQDISID
ncbi:MAG: hypothetical protein ACRBCL_01875 [Maritimibacter sp.]